MGRKVAAMMLALGAATSLQAQISLGSAVGLALSSDTKVRAAQADVDKARAALSETRSAYVPVVNASGGVGRSTGVPLGIPQIFNMSAQSLLFNFSQHDYLRAAHFGWDSAAFALQQAKDETAADVVTTYLALDNAEQQEIAANEALEHAFRLLAIVKDRVAVGQDARIEIPKADRITIGIRQQLLHLQSQIATLSDHLARITGLAGVSPRAVHDSIPELPDPKTLDDTASMPDAMSNPGVQAAFANALAKRTAARGDAHYLYRPQISFGANYSRISTDFTSYSVYYPAFTNPDLSRNAFSLGVEIRVPVLDQTQKAKALESAASARRAEVDAQAARNSFLEGRLKLVNSASELQLQAEAARDDVDIAQDQLDAVITQLQAGSAAQGAVALTPKDQQNAELAIAQRKLDLLKAKDNLTQAEISLLQQTGKLGSWLQSAPSQMPATGSLK